jgi:sulfite exporter TauE/SafE/copper chaperone CopZ
MSRRHPRTTSSHLPRPTETRRPDPTAQPVSATARSAKISEQPKVLPGRIAAPATPAETVTEVIQVAGMTCRSCEMRIQRHVGRIPNVERVTASAVRGRVVIESSVPISARAIAKAINAAGYEVGNTPWLERDPRAWLDAATGLVLLAAIAMLAQMTGLTGLASGTGNLSSGGLVVALLLGLAAGVSTCMALVGGLLLALSAAFQARQADSPVGDKGVAAQMRPALVFMAGRIAGYGMLGAVLGAVGASVTMPPRVTAVLMIAVAAVMIILGTRLTGLSPRIAAWSPTLPSGLGKSLGLHSDATGGYSDKRAAGLGAASFFLPCGFTQAVQIYALSTGSPLFAGALMATFAIGTAPGLLALAGLPVLVPSRMKPGLLRLVGVIVLGFALLNGSAGLRLAGIQLSLPGVEPVAAAAPPAGITAPDGGQVLTTYQDGGGYSPGNVSIYAGTRTHWIVKSSTTGTCAASLVVPSLGLQVRLHVGDNTIELPAMASGTLDYSCAMGMYGGQITIVDRPATPPTAAPSGI